MNDAEPHTTESGSGKHFSRANAAALWSVTAGVALLLVLSGCGRGGKIEPGPYSALGEVAAKATSSLLEGKGKVVLIVREPDRNASTALGLAAKVFKDVLKQTGGVQVTATETIKLTVALTLSGAEPLTPEKFVELLSKHASADALISFAGVPRLTPEQIGQLPQARPKVVAVVAHNPPTKAMFARGVLHLAILPRRALDASARTPTTTQEWFDANYLLLTPANAAAMLF